MPLACHAGLPAGIPRDSCKNAIRGGPDRPLHQPMGGDKASMTLVQPSRARRLPIFRATGSVDAPPLQAKMRRGCEEMSVIGPDLVEPGLHSGHDVDGIT